MASNPFNTGAQLGELIFGQPDDGGQSYAKGLLTGARARDSLAQARYNRARAIAGEIENEHTRGVTAQGLGDLLGITNPAAQQAALDLAISGGSDLRKLGEAGTPFYVQNSRAATAAANASNLGDMNAHLAVSSNTPIKSTDVTSSGEVFNPYAETGQDIGLTKLGEVGADLGRAKIGTEHAQAGAYGAMSNQRNAHARLYDTQADAGGWNPNTGSNDTLPSASKIDSVLPVTTVDPLSETYFEDKAQADAEHAQAIQEVQQWLAQHPGATLRDYVAHGPVGSPGTVEPVGTMPLGEALQAALRQPDAEGLGDLTAPESVAPAEPATQSLGSAGNPAQPTTQAEYDALPSDAIYVDPATGTTKRKR